MWIKGEKLFNSESFDEIGLLDLGRYHVIYGKRGKEKVRLMRYSDYEIALVELFMLEVALEKNDNYCELKFEKHYDDVRKRD